MIKSALQLALRPIVRSGILPVEKFAVLPCIRLTDCRNIHLTSYAMKELRHGKEKVRIKPEAAYIADGEGMVNMSHGTKVNEELFPDASTANKLFDNIPYNRLHIINVKATKNNTIISVTDHKGLAVLYHTAGREGFKNTRKGTNVAAQQTANVIGLRAIRNGIKTVRLRIQGLGPGREGSLKGLQLSGVNIVSITDDTRVSWNGPRPRKQRRI